jgi:hypothetical protein
MNARILFGIRHDYSAFALIYYSSTSGIFTHAKTLRAGEISARAVMDE